MTPEIRAFEFALGLFAVLIGLAIADIATSFHRLLRSPARVHWDPIALLAAAFAIVITVGMWFDLWGIRQATSVRHFFLYLVLVALFFVLFLIAAASLPDETADGVDLRDFYRRNHRMDEAMKARIGAPACSMLILAIVCWRCTRCRSALDSGPDAPSSWIGLGDRAGLCVRPACSPA